MEVAREVPTVEVPTVEVAVDDVEEVPMQIKHQLKLAGKLSVWNFSLELQVNFQWYKRRSKVQDNGSFTSRCVSNTWRVTYTSISSTSKSLVMNLLMLTMDIQILTMNFEC